MIKLKHSIFLFTLSLFLINNIIGQQNPCNPAIYADGHVGDLTQTVYPVTNTNLHEGSIPVYLNPSTINFQFNGYTGNIDVWINKLDPSNNGYSISSQSYINLFTSTSSTSTNYNLNVSNFTPGKYKIKAEFGAEGSVKRNRCLPYFIISRTLVNTTILPECAKAGQTIPITWNGGSGGANVNLVLRTVRNSSWFVPVNIPIPNTGNYNLVIPTTVIAGETYSVEINDGIQYVNSNLPNGRGNFKICADKLIRAPIKASTMAMSPNIKANLFAVCNCGSWGNKKIIYGDVSKDIVCNGSLTLPKNNNVSFNLQYNCSDASCTTKYEAVITSPDGTSTTVQIANNLNWSTTFTQSGSYTIIFKTYCNDTLCSDSCTYTILLR